MAKDQKPADDWEAIGKQAVQQTMEQARGAMERYFDFIQKTMSLHAWRGSDFGEKLKGYSEANVAAAQEFAQEMSKAKTFDDVIHVQTEFMRKQMDAFAQQTKELGETFTKAADDAMKISDNKSA